MSFKKNIVNYIKQLLKESLNCYCQQFNQYYQQKLKNKLKNKRKYNKLVILNNFNYLLNKNQIGLNPKNTNKQKDK